MLSANKRVIKLFKKSNSYHHGVGKYRNTSVYPLHHYLKSNDITLREDVEIVIDKSLIANIFNGRFYTRDALPVWTSFGKHFVTRPVIRV